MPKISQYEVAPYNPEAIVIGTEPTTNETKNYRLGDIPQGGGGGFVSGKRGRFFSTEMQSVVSILNPQFVTFTDTDTDVTDGFTIETNINNDLGRITAAHNGVYNLNFMLSWFNQGNQHQYMSFYILKNGVAVPNTIYEYTIKESSFGVTLNYMVALDAGDYIELIWKPTTEFQDLVAYSSPAPSTASVVATINQV